MSETRILIMNTVIDFFNVKGLKFTMEDISKKLHISKKTIYKEFADKDELFYATVDYVFSAIKRKEAEILADEDMDIVEKIAKVIVCLPDNYKTIDFRQMYLLRDECPAVYAKIKGKIETDWDETERLMQKAMNQGRIRDIPIPVIRLTIEGAIERFISTDALAGTHLSYEQALNHMIDLLVKGMEVKS